MSGYDRHYGHGHSPPRQPLGGGSSSRLTADYGAQQQQTSYPGQSSGNSNNNSSMASVEAWRDQQASLQVHGSLEDDDRLDDGASSEGLGAKRSHDSHGDSRDEPRRKRMVTTPHQVNVLSEELRRNPFPNAERRDELAKELGMEPRRVQVWFQNRRQAERLARGRPPYNMMYGNPWYPPPYGYPGYPGGGMPPPGAGFPPMAMTGDPSLDILIPYGPRRPSLMPPALQGDSLMRGGLPASHAMSGSLASRQSANDIAAASYRPGSEFGELSEFGRRDSSSSGMRQEEFGRPTTLAQDLAAMESQRPPVFDGHAERRSRGTLGRSTSHMPLSSSSRSSQMQPFQSLSPDFSLPLPSSLNRPAGLPSLSSSIEDPFQLPLPRVSSSSRSRGGPTPEDSPFGSPFDPSRTLAPPRSSAERAAPGTGRLPSLSQALEMHPELTPDPKSFRYPAGYEQSLLSGVPSASNSSGAGRNGAASLRRRNSISRMNETSTQGRSSLSSSTGLHSDVLPPLAPFSLSSGPASSGFRAPDSRRPPGNGEFAHPLMSANPRSLRRMPSDAAMQTSARRQSLRESDMGRDAFPPSTRYGL